MKKVQCQATMKRYCRLLAIMLGGVLLMTSLSACGQKETIPANRTREQYELEKEFQPLFDFLAEEKKDLSKVAVYGSSMFLSGFEEDADTSRYHVSLTGKNILSGTYTLTLNNEKKEYPVHLDNASLIYMGTPSREYDMDIFNLHLTPDFFKELSISDYMVQHPNTYMKSISYSVSSEEFLADILKKYDIESSVVILKVIIETYDTYSLEIYVEGQERRIGITNRIIIEEGKK